jgi:hypothetical protein
MGIRRDPLHDTATAGATRVARSFPGPGGRGLHFKATTNDLVVETVGMHGVQQAIH